MARRSATVALLAAASAAACRAYDPGAVTNVAMEDAAVIVSDRASPDASRTDDGGVTVGDGAGGDAVAVVPRCVLANPGNVTVFTVGYAAMPTFTCAPGQMRRLDGRIIATFGNAFRLGSCAMSGECPTTDVAVEVGAVWNTRPLAIPSGAFVTVGIDSPAGSPCNATLSVRSLPTWQGLDDPAHAGVRLYVLAGNGPVASGDSSPFRVSYVAERCGQAATMAGCDAPEEYALHVAADDGTTVDVLPGATATLQTLVGAAPRTYLVANLAGIKPSFDACSDAGTWAWVIYEQPAP